MAERALKRKLSRQHPSISDEQGQYDTGRQHSIQIFFLPPQGLVTKYKTLLLQYYPVPPIALSNYNSGSLPHRHHLEPSSPRNIFFVCHFFWQEVSSKPTIDNNYRQGHPN